jgi:Tol biopolymer transport system component
MPQLPIRKIILVIGFILFVAVIGFFLYYLFFAAPTTTETPLPTEEQTAGGAAQLGILSGKQGATVSGGTALEKAIAENKITKIAPAGGAKADELAKGGITAVKTISFDSIPSFHVAKNGAIYSYDENTGIFYKVNAAGEKEALNDKVYKNVANTIWSPTDDRAILEFPDGSNILFNLKTGQQTTLPKSWADFSFSPNGDKIVFKDLDANPEYSWLAIASPDGSGQAYIDNIGEKAAQVLPNWSPNGQVVALFKGGGTGITTEIQMVGANKENFQSFDAKGLGFKYQWSPTGDKILYSTYNPVDNMDPYLYIVDAGANTVGYNHKKINLKTWVNKCSFGDNNTAYCAVPKELAPNAGPAPESADSTPDYIYKVDLTTCTTSFIAEPEYNYTVDKITISPDGTFLYFTDKQTNTLHSIKLK